MEGNVITFRLASDLNTISLIFNILGCDICMIRSKFNGECCLQYTAAGSRGGALC